MSIISRAYAAWNAFTGRERYTPPPRGIPGSFGADASRAPIAAPTQYFSPTLAVATDIRASALASVPLVLYPSMDAGEPDNSSPTAQLFGNAYELVYATATDLFLENRAYWSIGDGPRQVSLGGARAPEIVYFTPEQIYERYVENEPSYQLRLSGVSGGMVAPDDMVVFHHYRRQRPEVLLASILKVERQLLAGKANSLDVALTPRLLYYIDGADKLNDQRYKDAMALRLGIDTDRSIAGRAILDSKVGEKVEYLPTPPDAELDSAMREVRTQVAAVSGVPASFLGSLEANTYNNVRNLYKYLWQVTLLDEMAYIQRLINSAVLPKLGYAGRIEFDTDGVAGLREDDESKSNIFRNYTQAFRMMPPDIYSTEEQRAILDGILDK